MLPSELILIILPKFPVKSCAGSNRCRSPDEIINLPSGANNNRPPKCPLPMVLGIWRQITSRFFISFPINLPLATAPPLSTTSLKSPDLPKRGSPMSLFIPGCFSAASVYDTYIRLLLAKSGSSFTSNRPP